MNQMTAFADHNISIVSIFNLQDVADNAVSRQTFDEIQTSGFVFRGVLVSVELQKVLVKVQFVLFAQLISTIRIWNAFDDAAKE